MSSKVQKGARPRLIPSLLARKAQQGSTILPLLSPETSSETYGVEVEKAYSNTVDEDVIEEQDAKLKMHIRSGQQAASALLRLEKATDSALRSDFLDHAKDVLRPYPIWTISTALQSTVKTIVSSAQLLSSMRSAMFRLCKH